ncbi:regulator of telomere elongation helicase 1 [Lampris incognitus]|uniref:regulator of telomere elongation helicase 1 n=1 Tax=Lampris incognitus TaxID=2546036 RepID=UPI0024B6318D|nr:regulator of telomere elongation helicase 1 [Lampris incognitus]
MPVLTLRGVAVAFPFAPYDCQKEYMSKVIECLQNKANGVLESPTGTGKTLCLLCATLAWRDHFKDTISARKIAQRLGEAEMFPNTPLASWGTAATDGDTPTYYTDIPKIIYASRTHTQLSQVIRELKNTSYKPKMCVLGSRDQLCINKEVMSQESSHVKIHMCKAKVSSRSCIYYNNVEEKSTDKELVHAIMDVEDLVKAGNKQRVCPYYLSRSLKQTADIIFMPYNYLLDPKSRRAHSLDLKGAVIIFDEAHNVERTCEESTSFDLSPYDLASAISAVDKLLIDKAKDTIAEDFVSEDFNSGLKLDITEVAKIKQMLLDLEAAIDSYDVTNGTGITKPGSFIYELFQRAGLTYSTKTAVSEALEQIIGNLTGRPGIFLNTSGLQKLYDIIQLVFCRDPSVVDKERRLQSDSAFFKVHIHQDTSHQRKKQNTDVWASSSSKKQGNVLSYWCFSPGFSMQDLVQQGARCIILTSGTLSPLSSFTAEMQIPFSVRLENSHVIQHDQIFVSIVDRGPDGVRLSSAFDRRFVPENMASLGSTIANLGRVVPHGLLVFFPSYPSMDKTLEFWRSNGHADRIENMKPIFVEPKGKGTFTEVINGYYDKVNDPKSKGGSFFAVCRGKASEGLDFADSFCRGVIITGLPFPPKMDPRVVLKMQFLDEMSRKRDPGVTYLSGQEWYRQQSSRAVNQAIGRVIRHKEDYGAIFLCDQRFKNPEARAQLPLWLKPYVRHHESFGNIVRDVAQFFRVAQKMRPPVEKKAGVESCSSEDSSDFLSSSIKPHPSIQSTSSIKAKVVDAHVPSLKKRKLNGYTGNEGMARLCIEYEAEMTDGQRRPVGLLDVLDHSDKRDGTSVKGPNYVVGEERASRLSTLSLQHDKRMDDEFHGGKRKIKLVQEQKINFPENVSQENKAGQAKWFLADMKKSLSQVNFERIMKALHSYKKTDDLEVLWRESADLLTGDANTHSLLRGFYQFIRPHHKKEFDGRCEERTGQGCGYKPEHSLSKEERIALIQHDVNNRQSATASSGAASLSTCQLNASLQLNHGGCHIGNHASRKLDTGSQTGSVSTAPPTSKNEIYSTFVADVKKAIGGEKFNQFFMAVQNYKKTERFDELVSTVVSLLTEKDDDFCLLVRFGMFVRPHHKAQYKELLDSLMGPSIPTATVLTVNADQPSQASVSSPVKTQSKISSFFLSSLGK